MSLQTWKKEFYPIPAKKTDKREAVSHSLRKWRGLTKANLKKHGIEKEKIGNIIWDIEKVERGIGYGWSYFCINGDSCALCHHFYEDNSCPLLVLKKQKECGLFVDGCECVNEYAKWTEKNNPKPMIRLLEKAQKLRGRFDE